MDYMRCRQIKNGEVVWFNRGKNEAGETIVLNNFVKDQEAVASSLTQRLSVIKKELWYNISYGVPLIDKVKSKTFMDSEITQIILSHPDVIRILSFSSDVLNHHYTYSATVLSTYGEIELNSQGFTV